jgi:hypothetical protein
MLRTYEVVNFLAFLSALILGSLVALYGVQTAIAMFVGGATVLLGAAGVVWLLFSGCFPKRYEAAAECFREVMASTLAEVRQQWDCSSHLAVI